ncbi:hypothetical protein [Streptomyces sp. SID3343]|uniref:hypothetical protein n=1 Tax=Streptomyces sp. SID3343 TaxID=2690260 RepID=UPI00136F13F1|nr:hypothetical protein [Streptomyces sp. SID3343]MYV99772.1 hypothetical protein [Streptomyces sp. SID3343]
MASIAWWWAIPGIALVIAATWAWWTCRSDRTPSMHDSMADYEAWTAVFGRVRDADPLGYEKTDDHAPETLLEPPGESP